MKFPRSIHPLDVAMGALVVAAAVFLVVTVPRYRWTGSVASGLMREISARVAIEVASPAQAAVAAELVPGPLEVETTTGAATIVVREVVPAPGKTRVVLDLPAVVDRSGRVFWNEYRLRRGDTIRVGQRDRVFLGTITSVTLDSP